MTCKICDRLLDSYEAAVRRYSEGAHTLTGMLQDDFVLAARRVDALRLACQRASDELMAHWRTEHANLKLSD